MISKKIIYPKVKINIHSKININKIKKRKYCSLQNKLCCVKSINYCKLLNTIIDGIPDIIGVYKPDHSIIFYNKAGYNFYNKTPIEIENKKCYHLLGRNSVCTICPTEKAIHSKKVVKIEKYIPELNKYMECCSSPVLNDFGEVELVVEQLRDITQRKKDLNMAHELQFKSITKTFPLKNRANMELSYIPVKNVSGDFFTLHKINDYSVMGMLTDVCGKGISSALNISAVKILFENICKNTLSPKEVLIKLNEKLIEYLNDNYIAGMCFYMDFNKNLIKVSGAGLNEFIYKDSNNNLHPNVLKGSFLGMFNDSVFDQCTIKFNKNFVFYFYSDGLESLFNNEDFRRNYLKEKSIKYLKKYIDNYSSTKLYENSLKDDSTLISIETI